MKKIVSKVQTVYSHINKNVFKRIFHWNGSSMVLVQRTPCITFMIKSVEKLSDTL